MPTIISNNPYALEYAPYFIPDSIPKEIMIHLDPIPSTRLTEDCTVMSSSENVVTHVNPKASNQNDEIEQTYFNGGIVSLSSNTSTSNDLSEIYPLDYRSDQTIEEKDLTNCVIQNASVFINDIASMEIDSFCDRPTSWEIESICDDSLDTEEDISSIAEWINGNEELWKC